MAKTRTLSNRPVFDGDHFEYLGYDELPALVLACKAEPAHEDGRTRYSGYNFKAPSKFRPIVHQTAGHCCHQHHLWARVLRPTPLARAAMKGLNDFWLGTDAGCLGVALSQLVDYSNMLGRLVPGARCESCYQDFEEAIYPIDMDRGILAKLTRDRVPADLDSMIKFDGPFDAFVGSLYRWKIYILGENCD